MNGARGLAANHPARRAIADRRSDNYVALLGKLFNEALSDKGVATIGALRTVILNGTADNYDGSSVLLGVFYFSEKTHIQMNIFQLIPNMP